MIRKHQNTPRSRISVLFAAEAPNAILLLRRGKDHHHFIKWDVENNTFIHGQWMRGGIVLCDLTPDGDKILYFATQYHKPLQQVSLPATNPLFSGGSLKEIYAYGLKHQKKKRPNRKIPTYMGGAKSPGNTVPKPSSQTWTALSKSPYFTALAFWPADGTWTGGGVFNGSHGVDLFEDEHSLVPHNKQILPKYFETRSIGAHSGGIPVEMVKRCAIAPSDTMTDKLLELSSQLEKQGLARCDWVFEYGRDKLLFSGEGRLFSLNGWSQCKAGQLLETADLVADFSKLEFEELRAPDNMQSW